ncbi:potassium voltage-gated channel subfamily A member 1-like [Clytia hemisphaerica]|uniref:BTB domain-containing protein n=1 Tax=Clytia hemisphaerica TaxID=252671 RepID=A0A7M5X2A8_9CNID
MFLKSSISSSQVAHRHYSLRGTSSKGESYSQHRVIKRTKTGSIHTTSILEEGCPHTLASKSFEMDENYSLLNYLGDSIVSAGDNASPRFPRRLRVPTLSSLPSVRSSILSLGTTIGDQKRINIIVQGKLYQTFEETLDRHSTTLLGTKKDRDVFYDPVRKAYVFEDHCHRSFDAILFYYQSNGILSRPSDVTRMHFIEELEFFRITKFMDNRQEQDAYHLKELMKEKIVEEPKLFREKAWMLFRHQNESCLGRLWTLFHLIITIISVLIICTKTLPIGINPTHVFLADFTINMIYTLELGGLLLFTPNIKQYFLSIVGFMDIVTSVSYYFFFFFFIFGVWQYTLNRICNFFLTFRIFKMFKFCESARYILYTLTETRYYLQLFATSATIIFFWFAILIYLVENGFRNGPVNEHPASINSIGDGVWYIIITCTGVGYGDMYPMTLPGKILGCAFCLLGLLLFCLPTSVLMNKFIDFYFLAEAYDKEEEGRAKILEARENLMDGK